MCVCGVCVCVCVGSVCVWVCVCGQCVGVCVWAVGVGVLYMYDELSLIDLMTTSISCKLP